MWNDIIKKIAILKTLDNNFTVSGADQHKYSFNSVVSFERMVEFENKLGVVLPSELRTFYLEVGNGGAGPDSGIRKLEDLVAFRPDQVWKGCGHADYNEVDDDYTSILTGLIAIMDRYDCYKSCIVTTGEQPGQIIAVSDTFIFNEADSLIDEYNTWLTNEINFFNWIKTMILSANNIYEIAKKMWEEKEIHPENALPYTASLLGFSFFYLDALNARSWKTVSGKIVDFSIDNEVQCMFNKGIERYRADANWFNALYKF